MPTNQEAQIGHQAVFMCQHSQIRYIDWFLDGAPVNDSNPDITRGKTTGNDNTTVNTLSIIARLEYDGFLIQCEAYNSSGETHPKSPAVLLTGTESMYP